MPRYQSVEQDDEIMLMRSPVHPALMRWTLRPEPAGRRRLAAAYLTAAAGAATSLVIFGVTVLATRHCQIASVHSSADIGCMAGFFRGLGLSIMGGLIVTAGFAIFIKLGLRYVAGLVALAAPVLLIAELLSIIGAERRPYVLFAVVGLPAAASWLAGRMLPGQDNQPATHTDQLAPRTSKFARMHQIGHIFVR